MKDVSCEDFSLKVACLKLFMFAVIVVYVKTIYVVGNCKWKTAQEKYLLEAWTSI